MLLRLRSRRGGPLCPGTRRAHRLADCPAGRRPPEDPGAKELVFDAGPREFLGLFQNAACVCTNSFHGAVFSLQFDRPFFTSMSPKELAQPTYSRIYSLLSRLGCADRVIGLDSTTPVDAPMDYEAVHEKLAAARADSLAYLKSAIEGTALPPEQAAGPTRTGPALCAPADCTGCTACASICPVGAISMVPDHEGFLRPVVSDACVLCRKCEAVCPGLHPRPDQEADAQPDPAHAVWCKDDGARQNSTSGGFFTVLARDTLQRGGVVFGAVLENGRLVRHAAARTEAELAPIRGSKYAQSDLGDTFRQVKDLLDGGTPVLFSGLACQVDGLRRYLGREYPQLLTVDLVCHGVPSPAVLAACVERLEQVHGKRITDLRFRDKSHGWQKAHLTALFEDGTSWTEVLYRTAFGRGFGMGLFLRPACAQCRYTSTHRPADFTLGDFWGLDPELLSSHRPGEGHLSGAGELRQGGGAICRPFRPVRRGGPPSLRGSGGQSPSRPPPAPIAPNAPPSSPPSVPGPLKRPRSSSSPSPLCLTAWPPKFSPRA